ncbi:hypothetical protein PF008_g10466 [Phytophthora fragariae]|uniref:Uncharacterized protein n=1 Tax=Phytophthora fragariae TaxID=53985 RepID=A0A6G0RU51_9STRA|nr:hypothetical protein PF008_g10466 [Phytophthora fragariae]
MEEQEVFWVLVSIVEELTPLYHTRTMTGSRADQRVFANLETPTSDRAHGVFISITDARQRAHDSDLTFLKWFDLT